MASNILITIEGTALTGKTTIAAMIAQALQDAGIKATFAGSEADRLHFDNLVQRNPAAEIAEFRLPVNVEIREVHINRAGRKIG